MFTVIKKMYCAPFEAFVYFIAFAIFATLYLQIVVTPVVILSLISLVYLNFLPFAEVIDVTYAAAALGLYLGIRWAEKVRKTYSVFGFHGYLAGHPEIDGFQSKQGNIVFRKGNLVNLNDETSTVNRPSN